VAKQAYEFEKGVQKGELIKLEKRGKCHAEFVSASNKIKGL